VGKREKVRRVGREETYTPQSLAPTHLRPPTSPRASLRSDPAPAGLVGAKTVQPSEASEEKVRWGAGPVEGREREERVWEEEEEVEEEVLKGVEVEREGEGEKRTSQMPIREPVARPAKIVRPL
jgi:hypothetical protein